MSARDLHNEILRTGAQAFFKISMAVRVAATPASLRSALTMIEDNARSLRELVDLWEAAEQNKEAVK